MKNCVDGDNDNQDDGNDDDDDNYDDRNYVDDDRSQANLIEETAGHQDNKNQVHDGKHPQRHSLQASISITMINKII